MPPLRTDKAGTSTQSPLTAQSAARRRTLADPMGPSRVTLSWPSTAMQRVAYGSPASDEASRFSSCSQIGSAWFSATLDRALDVPSSSTA